MKRRLVISAVNFTEGGPLTVLRQCLASAVRLLSDEWEIIALVHEAELVGIDGVRYIEFPASKRSWFARLYYEFWEFNSLSKKLRPDYWLSLHDISPRVKVPRQAVYCHNPSPFYKPRLRQALWEPGFFLFCIGYRYLYRLNIHANERVIVQQDWIRQAFQQMFGLTNVVVAHPITQPKPTVAMHQRPENTQIRQDVDSAVFLYPALPRVFKNFEVVCEAAKNLYETGHHNFELRLTISGKESRYAAYIFQRYSHVPTIRFIGRQSQQAMAAQYEQATAVVFPSKLETWGLPISEAKAHGKPILLANLPYAHEALGTYDQAGFFNPDDAQELSRLMAREMSGKALYTNHLESPTAEPFAPDWDKLIQLLIAAPLAPDLRSRPRP